MFARSIAGKQLVEVVIKYLKNNPENRQFTAASLIEAALYRAFPLQSWCPGSMIAAHTPARRSNARYDAFPCTATGVLDANDGRGEVKKKLSFTWLRRALHPQGLRFIIAHATLVWAKVCGHNHVLLRRKSVWRYCDPMPDDRPQPANDRPDPGSRRRLGTSRQYVIERLQREGLTQWIEPIESGRLSAYAVGVELGWFKRRATLSGANSGQAKRRRLALELAGKPPSASNQLSPEQETFFRFGPDDRWDDPFVTIEEARQAWLANRGRLLANHAPGRRPWAWHEFEGPADLPYDYDRETSLLFERGLLDESEKAELISFWRQEFQRAQELDDAAKHLKWADVPRSLIKRWQRERRRLKSKTIRAPETVADQPPPAA